MLKIQNLLVLVGTVILVGCGADKKGEYQFTCGTALSSAELAPFETPNTPGYDPNALKLLGKLSMEIFDANDRKKNYNVQFFENNRQRLVVQVYEAWEITEMDKAACAVFNFKDYILPPETIVVFYQNEKGAPNNHIVAGIKKS
jgi:hypothetical protein